MRIDCSFGPKLNTDSLLQEKNQVVCEMLTAGNGSPVCDSLKTIFRDDVIRRFVVLSIFVYVSHSFPPPGPDS
jgi:hypothetical protein